MKTVTFEDNIYAALVLTLQQATGTTTPIVTPPEVKPVEPEPVQPPVQTLPIDREALLSWLSANHSELAGEFGHVVEFSIKRPYLQDPLKVLEGYLSSVTHITPPAQVDVIYNAGTGYPIENVSQADAYFLFRRGQQVGKKLWYPILQGRQSQIGSLINAVEERDIVAAQAFDTESYTGPVRPYVERFLTTGSLKGFVLSE